jgi:hypothetical protein
MAFNMRHDRTFLDDSAWRWPGRQVFPDMRRRIPDCGTGIATPMSNLWQYLTGPAPPKPSAVQRVRRLYEQPRGHTVLGHTNMTTPITPYLAHAHAVPSASRWSSRLKLLAVLALALALLMPVITAVEGWEIDTAGLVSTPSVK